MTNVERLSTGISKIDQLICGGIPRGFLVAVTGEPGTGKTIFCIHFIAQGLVEEDKCVYVTTEESRESVIRQARQFGFNFEDTIPPRVFNIAIYPKDSNSYIDGKNKIYIQKATKTNGIFG